MTGSSTLPRCGVGLSAIALVVAGASMVGSLEKQTASTIELMMRQQPSTTM